MRRIWATAMARLTSEIHAPPPVCYHDEFGRSSLKGVGINVGETQKLGSAETPLSRGGVADLKIHGAPPDVLPRQIW